MVAGRAAGRWGIWRSPAAAARRPTGHGRAQARAALPPRRPAAQGRALRLASASSPARLAMRLLASTRRCRLGCRPGGSRSSRFSAASSTRGEGTSATSDGSSDRSALRSATTPVAFQLSTRCRRLCRRLLRSAPAAAPAGEPQQLPIGAKREESLLGAIGGDRGGLCLHNGTACARSSAGQAATRKKDGATACLRLCASGAAASGAAADARRPAHSRQAPRALRHCRRWPLKCCLMPRGERGGRGAPAGAGGRVRARLGAPGRGLRA